MMNFSKLKTAAGALSIAAVLGVTGLAASPAQAQSFSFGINGGNGQPSFSFGIGDDDRRVGRHCLSDRQLRNELRSQGYRDVRFGYERRDRLHRA